jgi:hypothetical protein
MHYALILAAMLGQASPVAQVPTTMGLSTSEVLAPITVLPSRTLRKNSISIESGYNSLVGTGFVYSRNIHPHFTLDTGVGFSLRGGQVGLRGRYNLLKSNVTPFVGLGVMYATGIKGDAQVKDDARDVDYIATLDQSVLTQGSLGVSWQTRHGLSLLGMVGYTPLLTGPNFKVKSGRAPQVDRDILAKAFDGGPTLALNIGYTF